MKIEQFERVRVCGFICDRCGQFSDKGLEALSQALKELKCLETLYLEIAE